MVFEIWVSYVKNVESKIYEQLMKKIIVFSITNQKANNSWYP